MERRRLNGLSRNVMCRRGEISDLFRSRRHRCRLLIRRSGVRAGATMNFSAPMDNYGTTCIQHGVRDRARESGTEYSYRSFRTRRSRVEKNKKTRKKTNERSFSRHVTLFSVPASFNCIVYSRASRRAAPPLRFFPPDSGRVNTRA